MMRSHSCWGGSPDAAHIIGKADAEVIPGMVLISFSTISPAGVQKKSTRARPSHDTASNAAQASRRTSAMASSPIGAGMAIVVSASRYLAWKS
jgi:hypothetical protein